jgi:hypothetical protein
LVIHEILKLLLQLLVRFHHLSVLNWSHSSAISVPKVSSCPKCTKNTTNIFLKNVLSYLEITSLSKQKKVTYSVHTHVGTIQSPFDWGCWYCKLKGNLWLQSVTCFLRMHCLPNQIKTQFNVMNLPRSSMITTALISISCKTCKWWRRKRKNCQLKAITTPNLWQDCLSKHFMTCLITYTSGLRFYCTHVVGTWPQNSLPDILRNDAYSLAQEVIGSVGIPASHVAMHLQPPGTCSTS